ncbi:MAG TPA: response regulator transcription factor [Ktedonobacterales bacterium]|nr:response regulator transcription factor [Ktedonobacterales bacterium]
MSVDEKLMTDASSRVDVGVVRVVVVDDQQLLREGIATLLRADPRIEVVARGANGQEAIDLAGKFRPDVVLVDIRMPLVDGIQAIREIKARWTDVRVVILTSFVYDGYVVEGMLAGADGYLLKDASPAALISGVIAVAAGEQVMEPGVARHVAEMLGKQSMERTNCYDGLTPRELQMLAMIARGLVAKEIAHELHISEKTVRNHVSNIYRKLGIYDRSQAVLYAIKKGLVAAD